MKMEYIIEKDGTVISNVLDRQGENCQVSVQQASAFGAIVSDERTGPDCDDVQEITGGGDGTG